MGFYDDMSQTVIAMLATYGQTVYLRRQPVSGGGYDPSTGGMRSGAVPLPDEPRKGLKTDAPNNRIASMYGQTLQDGTLIQASDTWLYLDADGFAPRLQDHLVVGAREYRVIDVQETSPGGIPVLYLLVLRA